MTIEKKVLAATMPRSRADVPRAIGRLVYKLRQLGYDIAPDADEGFLQSVLGRWRCAAVLRLGCELQPLDELWHWFWDMW